MTLIWTIIVSALIGSIAVSITNRGRSMGCLTKIFAGLLGAWIGHRLFGFWGPTIAGMSFFSSILGAIIVIAVLSVIFGDN
ncbi:GlsB/YeaQ/YmgE family stress response membrane protein [Streptococcus macacae]|uniref:Transglycosylase associated protein n=1 Tax=Streptococcus macacae NCTC 11558 TaxID=764298 RepID=G5JVJ3_9STRE|nr:GlsB/YeaQ/YmgE family stress response membrane protein [Streptococcus macacae]EHJ52361.1 transglycosylase associated protein [Streptococcus macacae NCTC 11558]SUN78587.1 transglycosylase associated protein [Streptococcus macacae NCTC 11558]